MAARRTWGRRFVTTAHKPQGVIQPRVQRVGPEHFGIVSVDCAKARFKWMLCDFYGKVLIPPTTVEHNRPELDFALAQLQAARQEHDLRDLIVAIERTGRYHHTPQHLFAAQGYEVRLVHPFTSKQYRQATDPGLKTDEDQLAASAPMIGGKGLPSSTAASKPMQAPSPPVLKGKNGGKNSPR